MTASARIPSLFGRFTAILQDHEHLGTTLKRLRLMCVALDTQDLLPDPLEPVRLLAELHAELSAHFSAEEAEAYFGTIAQEAPLLAPGIDQLKNQHAAMLGAIASLCRVADDATRAAELCMATRRLLAELEQHERAESLLLRDLFVPR